MSKAIIVNTMKLGYDEARVCKYEGKTYFIAGDIAECAGYSRKGVATYVNKLKKGVHVISAQVEGMGKRPLYLLDRTAVLAIYSLMGRPQAKVVSDQFKKLTAGTITEPTKEKVAEPKLAGFSVTANVDALAKVLPRLSEETKNAIIMDLARRVQ